MGGGNGGSGPVLADLNNRWNDLARRVLSALVLLPVALLCVWAGWPWFSALVALASVGLAHEWATLCGFSATAWPGVLLPIGLVAAVAAASGTVTPGFARGSVALLGLVPLLVGAVLILVLAPRPGDTRRQPRRMAGLFWLEPPYRPLAMGFPYLGLAAVALCWLRAGAAGWANLLFILGIIWASDVGAYLVGRLIGGPKLAPAVSPGKTWSGAAGGLAAAVLAGFGVAACISAEFSPSHVIVLTLGLGLISQAGDLLESALKRHFGVKDSGRLIPGHGGLLDRLDALLAVAPAAAMLAVTVGQGGILWR
jgi:phosphatidate cytidylyltransferase